jgi:hypothetical protein
MRTCDSSTWAASEWGAGVSTALNDSPIFGLNDSGDFYNGPYFDPNDPEERNNRQFTGSATYVIDGAGRHELKGGYEWFRSQNTGGNSQSPSGYVFDADYLTDIDGEPILDDEGRLMPVFLPIDLIDETVSPTLLETWIATPGAQLNVDTTSFYARDRWRIIVDQVAAKHNVSATDVRSARRTHAVVVARHECFYRLKHETTMSLPQIGRLMGNKDHTTVLNGIHRHEARIASGEAA